MVVLVVVFVFVVVVVVVFVLVRVRVVVFVGVFFDFCCVCLSAYDKHHTKSPRKIKVSDCIVGPRVVDDLGVEQSLLLL